MANETHPSTTERVLPAPKERLLRDRLDAYHQGMPGVVAEDALQIWVWWYRHRYVPWLSSQLPLSQTRIMEVGSGTGASTIPLAECGAQVTALDLNGEALDVLRLRAELHGVADRVHPVCGSSADLAGLAGTGYDIVAYTASLEHMTHPERQAALRATWSMLGSGGALVVVDTPNRLWHTDSHTAMMPFFHWLPDDVAVDYSVHSARVDVSDSLRPLEPSDRTARLARWGRGVSFHDFHLAIGPIEQIEIAGEWDYRRDRDPAWAESWAASVDGRYQALLREIAPQLPRPWLDPELAFILRKP